MWTASLVDLRSPLGPGTMTVWNALSLIGVPISTAALGEVLQLAQRVVASEVDVLCGEGVVHEADAGRFGVVRSSPSIAEVPHQTRRLWSERAAAHLPPRSEARFRHLVAGGRYEDACDTALPLARSLVVSRRIADAIAILDPALGLARRYAPTRVDLYAELLAALAEAVRIRDTRSALDLALYHADLSPDRGERVLAWTTLLSAAVTRQTDPTRALEMIERADRLPTHAHVLMSHGIANLAAWHSGSIEARKACASRAAAWVRESGGRPERAHLSTWTGWLRYDQGRYEAAYRLHRRSARLTRRPRASSLCNAAMAAIEAGALEAAVDLGREARRAARGAWDVLNEARAELVLRQAQYRLRVEPEIDEELVSAATCLDEGATRGTMLLNEAAVGWRGRRMRRSGELALEAAQNLRVHNFDAAALLADVLAHCCGAPARVGWRDSLASQGARLEPVGLVAQSVALAVASEGAGCLPPDVLERASDWARAAPHLELRREVLSPRETLERIERTP